MDYRQYGSAQEFLGVMGPSFLENEALYGLMYGICLRLVEDFTAWGEAPLLATAKHGDITLAAVMTPPWKVQLCAPAGFSDSLVHHLADSLFKQGWRLPGVIAEASLAETFAERWSGLTGIPFRHGMRQRIHRLDIVRPVDRSSGIFRKAGPGDLEIAEAWARGFHRDCFGDDDWGRAVETAGRKVQKGELFLWCDPDPVSMAARVRPTATGESISFVYTPLEFRGRGYATSLVAELSLLLLRQGRQFCSLYTDLANPTSNSIYRRIGYLPVADVVDMMFRPGETAGQATGWICGN